MKLIADSGSTKTDWRLLGSNGVQSFQTSGINPFYMGSSTIEELLTGQLKDHIQTDQISHLYYYGAGCSSPEKCQIVSQALQQVFINAHLFVSHDLLGAARALCGNQAGIAAILGTGSNSCLYDGEKIMKNVPSLGFMLGDEGSGAYMGKLIARDYLYGKMPPEVKRSFEAKIKIKEKDFLSQIYQQEYPNRFLAQYAKWLFQQKNDTYRLKIATEAFEAFFENHICQYPDYQKYPFHCLGSVAYYFKPILAHVAQKHQVQLGNVIETPIAALALYHNEA